MDKVELACSAQNRRAFVSDLYVAETVSNELQESKTSQSQLGSIHGKHLLGGWGGGGETRAMWLRLWGFRADVCASDIIKSRWSEVPLPKVGRRNCACYISQLVRYTWFWPNDKEKQEIQEIQP